MYSLYALTKFFFNYFKYLLLGKIVKWLKGDVFFFFQKSVYFGLPSSDEGSIKEGVFSNWSLVRLIRKVSVVDIVLNIMEVFCASEHESVKGSAFANLDFSEVRCALTLMYATHVTTEALTIFELLLADIANVSVLSRLFAHNG